MALAKEHRVFRLNRQSTGAIDEIVHDLAEPMPVDRLPRHVDTIIHTAGLVGQSASSLQLCQRVNVDATRELADYAARAGATRFLFCSTGGVYLPSEQKLTEQSVVSPPDAYTESKLSAEVVVQSFDKAFAVQVLRLFFPFGPMQKGRLISNLIQRVAQGEPIQLMNTSGQPIVTPLYIDDLVEIMLRVLDLPDSFVANVAGDEAVSIRALAEMIGKMLSREVVFDIKDSGMAVNWFGSNELISRLTGYSPRVSLESGLERTVAQFVKERMLLN